jgi:hypothetical protein
MWTAIGSAISAIGVIVVAMLQLKAAKYRKVREAQEAAEKEEAEQWRKDEFAYRIAQGNLLVAGGNLAYTVSESHMSIHVSDSAVRDAQDAFVAARDVYGRQEKKIAQRYLQTGGMAS